MNPNDAMILLEELVYDKVNKILAEPKKLPQRAKIFNIQGIWYLGINLILNYSHEGVIRKNKMDFFALS